VGALASQPLPQLHDPLALLENCPLIVPGQPPAGPDAEPAGRPGVSRSSWAEDTRRLVEAERGNRCPTRLVSEQGVDQAGSRPFYGVELQGVVGGCPP